MCLSHCFARARRTADRDVRLPTVAQMRQGLVAAALCSAMAGAPAYASPVSEPDSGRNLRLSDERTITRWAHTQETAPIRHSPRRSSRSFARLRFLTEDREAEVYVVLRSRLDSAERAWLKIRVPMRPNGRVGWVPREALGPLYVVRTRLVIDRRTLRAVLFRRGRRVWSAPVGVGGPATPTPAGRFYVRERLRGLGDGDVYGPWAFGTSAYSPHLTDWPGGGVVGIHGTNQPELVPGRPSHGCVRIWNGPIRRLARLMPIGTPVQVR